MFPYFSLLLIPLGLYVAKTWLNRQRGFGTTNCKDYKSSDIIMSSFFIVLLLLLVCRYETVGRDLLGYKYYGFEPIGNSDLAGIFNGWDQWIFYFYTWFIYNFISSNYQVYLAITSVLTLVPIAYIYLKERAYSYMQIVIFVNMSTFVMMFSGIRQSLAFAVGMLAYDALCKKKLMIYLLLVLVALFIHHSGFMLWFMYPLYMVRLHKGHLMWVLPLVFFLYTFAGSVFNFITPYLVALAGDRYDSWAQESGAVNALILFLMFTVYCFVIVDEKKVDDETNVLRNFLVLSAIVQPFASVHSIAMRMTYYYQIFIPIALAKCMNCASPRYRKVVKLANVVLCVFFTWYFLYGVYSTYTNYVPAINDALGTIPYKFFWE